jgi:hypothetical protein
MLKRMQAQSDKIGCVLNAGDAKDAAFLAQFIIIKWVRWRHGLGLQNKQLRFRRRIYSSSYRVSASLSRM